MTLQFFCPRWGSETLSWEAFFDRVRAAGYDGVEYGISRDTTDATLDIVWDLAAQKGLLLIAQHYDTYEPDFDRHYMLYSAWLEKMTVWKPVKIDSQTGKDYFSFDQNRALIEEASRFTSRTGIPVCHETHRNKFAFAAHITSEYLYRMPDLTITLDVSHWVCVAESWLDDQSMALDLAIARTEHIHARVGYPEGPQVTDPRLPEWKAALETHLGWWDRIVARKREEETTAPLTITPEFGPFPYMVALPVTQIPIANQWDINVFMMKLLRERYEATSLLIA